jgi:hypothetical protein
MAGYGSDDGFTAYATAAGYTVPSGDVTAARQRGSAYIDGTYGLRFPGVPTGGADQERAWPRTGATDYWGNEIGSAVIPAAVINASYEAALIELQSPGSLSVVGSASGAVKRERVGPLEVEYAGASGDVAADNALVSTRIAGLLATLLVATGVPWATVV